MLGPLSGELGGVGSDFPHRGSGNDGHFSHRRASSAIGMGWLPARTSSTSAAKVGLLIISDS